MRPGRCFAHVDVRELRLDEAASPIRRLSAERGFDADAAIAAIAASGNRSHSLAEIYQAVDRLK